ncbi:MAG: chemotaxis protein CheX [Bacillota bacterium]
MTETQQAPTTTINPKLIVPFVDAIRGVFSTMVGVPTTVERPHVKTAPAPTYDVSSIIGFSGDVVGSVVVSFQMTAAEKLATAFAGSPIDPASPDFADAIGELANMIAGSAKKHLGALASITVPSVVIGSGHSIARLSDVPCVVIPCKTGVGDFAVEVSVKQVKAPAGQ